MGRSAVPQPVSRPETREIIPRLPERPPGQPPAIPATATTEDGRLTAVFDASPFFETAASEDVHALHACGWRDGHAADEVVVHMAGRDPALGALFEYLDARPRPRGWSRDLEYRASVDEGAAYRWALAHRPDLAACWRPASQ